MTSSVPNSNTATDNLTDGFLAKVHAPIETVTHRVQEVEQALDELQTKIETEHQQLEQAEQIETLTATMNRVPHYLNKTQNLVKNMNIIREKSIALRKRTEKLEHAMQNANEQLETFAKQDAQRESKLEAAVAAPIAPAIPQK